MPTTVIEQRQCTKCAVAQPRTHEFFPANKRMSDGLSSWCRGCHRKIKREAAQRDPEANRARATEWYRQHPELVKARSAAWKQSHPERARANDRASYNRSIACRSCNSAKGGQHPKSLIRRS